MSDNAHEFEAHDFFRSDRFVADPYPYFDYLREQSPVVREPHQGIVMVTGYDEALAIYNDPVRFSSCMSTTGPMAGNPIPLEGHENEDISELIEAYRDQTPFHDQLPTMDPPTHSAHRSLLMSLITPRRLKENEDFMWKLADQQIDTFLADGECEFMDAFAQPFAGAAAPKTRHEHLVVFSGHGIDASVGFGAGVATGVSRSARDAGVRSAPDAGVRLEPVNVSMLASTAR